MQPGAFSLSLAVKDIEASKTFYGHLGFSAIAGDASQGWLILQAGTVTIGLFQGMLASNMMTFNPGWDSKGKALAVFEDIRLLQKKFQNAGIAIPKPIDPEGSGPASFSIADPDGNAILFDQHV